MQRPALLRCLGAMVEGGGEAAAAKLLHTYGLLRVRVGVRVRLGVRVTSHLNNRTLTLAPQHQHTP